MKFAPTFLLVSLALLLATTCFAGIYSWKDKNGTIHFSDTKPPAEDESSVQEVIKTKTYTVPVFKITDADDPGIIGTYIPISSWSDGLPRYELDLEEPRPPKKDIPRLEVEFEKGKWQWRIRTGYSSYHSDFVQEGTPADKVGQWRKKYDMTSLTLVREDITTPRKMYDYSYRYGLDHNSSDLPGWQKVAYKVSGHPEPAINGVYQPVDWSSETPRYRTEWDMCLVLYPRGSLWQWALGDCGMLSYSSSREPEQTMPQQVKRWMKNAGMQYLSFQVEEITL